MTVLWAFDLDGVLAETAPKPSKTWGKMSGSERAAWKAGLLSWYDIVPPLLKPEVPQFHVITARKDVPDVRRVTTAWLERHFPGRVLGLHMLAESRSIENVAWFKGNIIKTLGVSHFVEDNMKILKALRVAGLRANLYFYNGKLARVGGGAA